MSEDLNKLKERIYNEGTVGKLLEELGCDCLKLTTGRSGDDLLTARAPNSSNKRGIQIYLSPTLHSEIVNESISGNIYSVVGFLLFEARTFDEIRSNLYQIKTYICDALGYDDLLNQKYIKPEPKTDWNWWLRDIQRQRQREIEITENEVLDEIILNEFVTLPWEDWYLKEGISLQTQKEYGIGFHVLTERVTIPVHNRNGQLIGIKGRYVGEDKELLDHKKYNYIYPCSKNIELFNLHRALPYILEKKEALIFEGAKTTIKLWDNNIRNALSIEGDKLSPVQAKLLKELGLDVDLIFGWDKGKDEEFVKKNLRLIKNRRVYYLFDNANRYEDKDSPTDKGIDTFLDLYNNDKHKFL